MITSRKVEPGWLPRYGKESLGLFLRSPAWVLFFCLGTALFWLLVPTRLELGIPEAVLLDSFWFLLARSLDYGGGSGTGAVFLQFLRDTAKDIWHLCRDILIFALVVGLSVGLFFAFAKGAAHSLTAHNPVDLSNGALSVRAGAANALWNNPFWSTVFQRAESILTIGWLEPGAAALVWLTLAVGNQPVLHFWHGYQAAVKNWEVTAFLCLGIVLVPGFLETAECSLTTDWQGLLLLGLVSVIQAACAFFLYCFLREVFEGEKKSREAKKREHSLVLKEVSVWH